MLQTKTWRVLDPGSQPENLVIRLLVGLVFMPEGLKKFMFAAQWGMGRFAKIGIPHPAIAAHLVGGFEFTCGLLIVLGLATRVAALPLLVVISTAIATTKVPLLWSATVVSSKVGFWSMQAESRTDYAMAMGLLFLIMAGAGPLSLDGWLSSRRERAIPSE